MARIIAMAVAALLAVSSATPLDDYVSRPEAVYNYVDTHQTFKSVLGSTVYVLNVTSLTWLDNFTVTGPYNSNVWSHTVVVIVPKGPLKITNISMAYLTGNCNHDPKPPKPDDEELLSVDLACRNVGAIGIIVYQIPNCPLVFEADPSQSNRTEDAVIAWTWKSYLEKDLDGAPRNQDGAPWGSEWLARLPMAKGAFQSMRSAQDFINNKLRAAEVDGWVVSGASKRGWTTWAVGSATCTGENCVNIVALAPLVPIAPDIRQVVHRQWQSYGGFTFAFKDYTALGLTEHMDDPRMIEAMEIVDPKSYGLRLSRIPKFVVVSSDDEFMSMDWTNIWYDDFQRYGETHLLIVQDSEHSLATGIPEVVQSLSAVLEALGTGTPRPSFGYARDEKTGAITVTIPEVHQAAIDKVVLRHSETISKTRRDFRWVVLSGENFGPCHLPMVKLPVPIFGGNCIQPIVWLGTQLNATAPGIYTVTPPEPKHGHWTGYYVEVFFKSALKSDFLFTTPGYTWPDTLPFPPCVGKACVGRLL